MKEEQFSNHVSRGLRQKAKFSAPVSITNYPCYQNMKNSFGGETQKDTANY